MSIYKPEQIGNLYCVLYAPTFSILYVPIFSAKYNPLNWFYDPLTVFISNLKNTKLKLWGSEQFSNSGAMIDAKKTG